MGMNAFLWQPPEIPWKSEWRLDLERRSREEALKPRPIVKAAQIQVRQEKAARAPRNPPGTGRKPRTPKTARRVGIRNPRKQTIVERVKCAVCEITLNKNNTHGFCTEHWQHQRRLLNLGARPTCKFEGCDKKLYRDNKIGLCRQHGDPMRKKAWAEANREKVIEQHRVWNKANPDRRSKAQKAMVR